MRFLGATSPVGIDPQHATRLEGLLDDAAASLEASAARVQALLDEAGMTSSVPAEIRRASRTCGAASVDLRGRIRAAKDGGTARVGTLDVRPHQSALSKATWHGPDAGRPAAACGPFAFSSAVMSCIPEAVTIERLVQPPAPTLERGAHALVPPGRTTAPRGTPLLGSDDTRAEAPSPGGGTEGGGTTEDERSVGEVLAGKKGSITRQPLPKGSPSWDEIREAPMSEIKRRAAHNEAGYRTIKKLLTSREYDR